MAAVETDVYPQETHQTQPEIFYRKDYKPTPYKVDTIELTFILNEDYTTIQSKIKFYPNPDVTNGVVQRNLILNGRKDVELKSLKIEGKNLTKDGYKLSPKNLTIHKPPEGQFVLETEVQSKPQENRLLEGLYKSGGNFCTQCEAEGFRGITYYYDRPDVLAKYQVRIEADKKLYPVLLSNGNMIDSGELGGGRHYAVYQDPLLKPCYLFALVAGNLEEYQDTFTTMNNRKVTLKIFSSKQNIDKVQWGMESLKKAMKWDEERFGREYDLDLFNIVAVDDFNMGAMENKSLNIFNSRRVLSKPEISTDTDIQTILGVVGHEYFHNWTGNRVTCQDWFQLTLKEGLTIFRDQEFSSDTYSRPVKRIDDVIVLRNLQFPEDAGSMAHPIRPEQYIKMDNFYTVTVYEKGSEVIRMYQTLLGREGFRKGLDLYFERHDGQAVTCDDFLQSMSDANNYDLKKFGDWYGQSGTPHVTVDTSYNKSKQSFTIKTKQETPPTPDQPQKKPLFIPLKVGLLGPDGKDIHFKLANPKQGLIKQDEETYTAILYVQNEKDEFILEGVQSEPVPSILRDFSAPIVLKVNNQTNKQLVFQMAHDSDPFNRWEAGQKLMKNIILRLYEAGKDIVNDPSFNQKLDQTGGIGGDLIEAVKSVLQDHTIDGSFKAFALAIPADLELINQIPDCNPIVVYKVRKYIIEQVAKGLKTELQEIVKQNEETDKVFNPWHEAASKRAIKNSALRYLGSLNDPQINKDLLNRFRSATNMTDKQGALYALLDSNVPERDIMLDEFAKQFEHDNLTMLKWMTLHSMSNKPDNIKNINENVLKHKSFSYSTPNCCYSTFVPFTRSPQNFHKEDGSGYEFIADQVIKLDDINNQVAARVVGVFSSFKAWDPKRREQAVSQLKRIAAKKGLSENVYEIVNKCLSIA